MSSFAQNQHQKERKGAGVTLQKTKIILRSLINSTMRVMTAQDLDFDHQQSEGRPIPYVEHGYRSLESFLITLNDTLICKSNRDGTLMVYAIQSPDSIHISTLVRNQKKPKNFVYRPTAQALPRPRNKPHLLQPERSRPNGCHYGMPPPSTLNQVSMIANDCLIQQHFAGLPSSVRHQVFNQYLQSCSAQLPQLLFLPQQWHQTVNRRTEQPHQLLMPMRPPCYYPTFPPAINNHQPQFQAQYRQHSQMPACKQQQQPRKPTTQPTRPQQKYQTLPPRQQIPALKQTAHPQQQHRRPQQQQFNTEQQLKTPQLQPQQQVLNPVYPQIKPVDIISISSDSDSNMSHAAQQFQSLPRHRPRKIDPAYFRDPPTELVLIGSDNNTQQSRQSLQAPAIKAQPSMPKQVLSCDDPTPRSLTQILASTHLGQIPASVPPVVQQVVSSSLSPDNMALPLLNDDDPLFMIDLPDNIAKFDTKVAPARLPDTLTEGSLFRLFVTEVNSPTKFWFHIESDNHPLDALMTNIENYYANAPAGLQMREHNAIPGLLCAARFNDLWHRAIIVDRMRSDRTIKVHFFDYGTTSSLALSDLQYLLLRYTELPAQAYRGALFGIQPPLLAKKWTRDSTYVFLDMVAEVMLYGRVIRIDSEERIVRLILVNTTRGADDLILHRVLLQRGFASVLPDKIDCRTGRPYQHFTDRHPTFEMLETGAYPSFGEIGVLMTLGTDYEAILDENWMREEDEEVVRPLERFHHTNPFAQGLFAVDVSAQANMLQNIEPKPVPTKSLNI